MTVNKPVDVGPSHESSFIENANGYCKESLIRQKDIVKQAISSPLTDGDKWLLTN